jgi:hypothetical protein
MVRIFFLLGFFWWTMLEATPSVDASIDATESYAHFPIKGTITITHQKEEKIDPQSFVLEGKPLEVLPVKEVKMSASADTLVSIYRFQLPAQDKGLFVLPSISMKIGGQTYQTIPSTYEVQEETSTPTAPSRSSPASTPLIFRLEASVEGPSTLYPGERTTLLYRILYNRNVDLTHSELPLIHPAHFQKVGDVHIQDYQLKEVTVQDLTQEVEASEPGTFSFGPSFIEGYAYTLQAGQKVYDPTLLKAEALPVTLNIKPFPQFTQPASFTGALGQIKAEAHLNSAPAVGIGDLLQVQVKIQGVTNLADLRLPLLQCQPGFSGFFDMSDLLPYAEVKGKTKLFYLELRPLTSLINQIPSLELSSFDPSTGKYLIQHTSPIPIQVKARSLERFSFSPTPSLAPFPSLGKWPTPLLSPLEIKASFIPQIPQPSFSWQKSWWVLWMIPIGLSLLLLQKAWQRRWLKRPQPLMPPSKKLLKQALKTGSLQMLEQAFWVRLWEKGKIPPGMSQLEKMPSEGTLAPLHLFLFQLQALQYSAHQTFDPVQLQQTARQLFKTI